MPRHYPSEVRREACERMLAGEAIKDLADELGITIEDPLSLASPIVDRHRSAPKMVESFEADPLAAARRRIQELEAEVEYDQGGQCDLRGGRASTQKEVPGCPRAEQPRRLLKHAACQLVGLGRSSYYKMKFGHPS